MVELETYTMVELNIYITVRHNTLIMEGIKTCTRAGNITYVRPSWWDLKPLLWRESIP